MTNKDLDALVATKVMGWKAHGNFHPWCWWDWLGAVCLEDEWNPSTELVDAFKVVEKMRDAGWKSTFLIPGRECGGPQETVPEDIFAVFSVPEREYKAFVDTLPVAICHAALKAMGVEVET